MASDIQESINNAIDIIVGRRIDALALDKTVIGVIDSVVNSTSGIYKVKYDGGYFNAEAQSGAIFPKGMSVYVQIPQNDMTKKKLILGRASNLRESAQADVVISNLNNFVIIGNSIVSPKEEVTGEGIRSYHDETNETAAHPITHRAKLIYSNINNLNTHYSLDLDAFSLYKENATALMVQAEFRTALDTTQQYTTNGIYGIGLNLSFNNSDYQYGTTQGEIFDYFAPQIKATIEKPNNTTTNISMQEIDNSIQTALNKNTFADLTKSDGILDEYIAYSNSLIFAYAAAAPNLYIKDEDEIMQSYLAMLSDLKNVATSLTQLKSFYQEWRAVVTGKAEKQVSYVLDSNDMTGNPYSFTSWSTQYAIFNIDFDNLKSVDSILFYKQGFNWSTEKEVERGEDIFIRNLKIYALQPISAVNGDYRLEIQSPDGLIFETLNKTEKLSITGKVTKAYYENLSDYATYYWFKKNPNVTAVNHSLYHQYGGIGWEYIGGPNKKGNSKTIVLYGNENTAYKNKYKCVCLIDETVLLKDEFILYNNAVSTDIEIDSDLGQNFSFDAGTPQLTCLLKVKGQTTYTEYTDSKYRYIWSITINNVTTSFAYDYLKSLESIIWDNTSQSYIKKPQSSSIISIAEAMQGPAEGDIANIIQGVQFFRGDQLITTPTNIPYATRIKYPVENLAMESVVTFTCAVSEIKDSTTTNLGEGTIDLQNQGHPQITSYRLVLENGDQVFQYDEYGNPPNSPKLKSPQEIKPVIPHLLNPAGIEVSSKNYKVQWTLPIENTLIKSNVTLGNNPFDEGKVSLDNNTQCSFSIKESYNEDYLNNQILCRVTLNDEVIQNTTDFYFGKVGSNGTNGTDMVAKIVPVQEKQILNTQPVILYEYNNGNNVIFNTGTANGSAVFLANSDSSKTRIFKAKLYQKNEEISESSYSVRWNVAGNPQTTTNTFSRYIRVASTLSGSTWNSSLRWDGSFNAANSYFPVYTIRAQITYQNKDYYAFYSFPVIYYNSTFPVYNRIAINKSTLLKEIVYNADGRNPVYSHNQGVEIINVPADCTITWYAYGGVNSNESTADFKLLLERNGKKKDAATRFTKVKNNFIYVLPNDEYDGSNTNNRIVAHIYKGNTEIAVVTVPLHMTLNTFGLASLNAWDGNTVTIDEDGGYVMAPQVGAGEKDSNNRFTGILMGKTETYTGSSANEIETGLFGYAHGIQSIFLDSNTGNAYFGLPNGKILDKSGSIPIPKDADNFNEGRIELKPGDVSKIGGWRLGRRALYYTQTGNLSQRNMRDWTPNNNGVLGQTNTYYINHEKDIASNDVGLLLYAGDASKFNPYISIKGRKLVSSEIVNDLDSQIAVNDSLEILMDPQTPTLFTVFRHNGNTRGNKQGSRTFLAGINNRGELVANAVQTVATGGSGDSEKEVVTKTSITYLKAFKDTQESAPSYIGAKFSAGSYKFLKAFISKGGTSGPTQDSTLYITGGESTSSEYVRPISIHGNAISLYALDNDNSTNSNETTQKSKIIISNSQFYGGNENSSYINLPSSGPANITTVGRNIIKGAGLELKTSGNQDINLRTNNDNDNYSYLKLDADGNASLLGAQASNFIANNGNINLRARTNGEDSSWLTLTQAGDSTLRGYNGVNIRGLNQDVAIQSGADTTISAGSSFQITAGGTGNQLYLPVASINSNAYLQTVRPLSISSVGNLSMKANSGNSGGKIDIDAATTLTEKATGAILIQATGNAANTIITIDNSTYNPSNNNAQVFEVTSKLGGFDIRKSTNYNHNLLNTDLGIQAQYGYFYDYRNSNQNSVYAIGTYITAYSPGRGAQGYAFSSTCSIPAAASGSSYKNNFSKIITGDNVYELILNGLNQAFEYARSAYAEAKVATDWINNNSVNLATKADVASKLDASSFSDFKDGYSQHKHDVYYIRGERIASVNFDNESVSSVYTVTDLSSTNISSTVTTSTPK